MGHGIIPKAPLIYTLIKSEKRGKASKETERWNLKQDQAKSLIQKSVREGEKYGQVKLGNTRYKLHEISSPAVTRETTCKKKRCGINLRHYKGAGEQSSVLMWARKHTAKYRWSK